MRQWRSLHLPGLIPDWLPPGVRGLNTYVLEPIDEVLHLLGEALRIVSLALVLLGILSLPPSTWCSPNSRT